MAEHTTAAHTSRLTELRRLDSADKARRVLAALDATISAGEPLTIAALARRAGVSRRFVYDHPELRAEAERRSAQAADRRAGAITAGAQVTAASLRADLANARAANHRQHTELEALRRRLGQILGRQVLADLGDTPVTNPTDPRVEQLDNDPVRDERRTRTMPTRTRRRPPDQPRTHRPHQPGTPLTTIHTRPTSTTQPAVAHTCARHKPAGHNPCRTPHTPEKATRTSQPPDLPPRRPGAQGTGTRPHRATRRPTRPLPTPGRRPGLPRRTVIMPNTQRRQRSPPRAHPNRSA